MKTDKYLAARLLAGKNKLSSVEKDAILHQVLKAQPRSRPRPVWGWMLASGASLALVLLLVTQFLPKNEPAQFASKGAGLSHRGFSINCLNTNGEDICQNGSKLIFRSWAPAKKPFFTAFARASDARIIWYFPSSSQPTSLNLSNTKAGAILEQAVRLGPEHKPGTYTIYGLFSKQALDKTAVRSIIENDGPFGGDHPELFKQALKVE